MAKTVAVSAGHHPASPGFSVGNISEYSEMAVLAGMVVQKIQRRGHRAHLVGTGGLTKKIEEINSLNADCAVELHLNAGGGHGHETLFCPGSTKGAVLATAVNSAVGLVLNSRNRGVKEGWYRMDPKHGPDAFLARTNCPAVITETYFLDNADERARFTGSINIADAVAERIAVGILGFLNK